MEIMWSYLLFDTLMHKILNGHQSVRPYTALQSISNKTNNISFKSSSHV